ncbi:hypothetical protein AX17_007360 [Amanita inopinata Kibby_2008]|nr:hypothetical protein AX17_007360 [Amanita inopinata Kibby_2008]
MASLARLSMSQSDLGTSRVKRKPPPILDLSLAERYPAPDPNDPFAPLWVLRSRTSSAQLIQPQALSVLSANRRRLSAFNLQPAYRMNATDDDAHYVVSDSEQTYARRNMRQSRARQRSHSLAVLTHSASPIFEFPSIRAGREQRVRPTSPLAEPGSDVERLVKASDRQSRILHITSDASLTQKTLSRFLKPKKTSSTSRPKSPPRVRKTSISRPVLASQPPALSTFSLALQTSIVDPQCNAIGIGVPPAHAVSVRNGASSPPPSHVMKSRSQSPVQLSEFRAPLPTIESTWPSMNGKISRPTTSSPPPSTLSHSAFIHISYPTPSAPYSQPLSEEAYTHPRPAPRPPPGLPPLTRPRKVSRTQYRASKVKPSNKLPTTEAEWALPTYQQLKRAASLSVVAESGLRISFGSLFESQRTIVIFIRHFWCPLCQDYMASVRSFVQPGVLGSVVVPGSEEVGNLPTKLVVVSNGSHSMIQKYKQIFEMPFDMYTDPSLAVYMTLGMGRGGDKQHYSMCPPRIEKMPSEPIGIRSERQDKRREEAELNSGYVKHGTMGGIMMVLARALKVGMPVWENGGNVAQLGGEFVFGPGLTCSYAHRMQTPKGHAPIQDVVRVALEAAVKSSFGSKKGVFCVVANPLSDIRPPVRNVSKSHACPSGTSTEIGCRDLEDSTCSYEIVTERMVAEARNEQVEDGMSEEQEQEWMIARERHLCRLRERKNSRRGFIDEDSTLLSHCSDDGMRNVDDASVMATCSDLDRSTESTVRQSLESEEHISNKPFEREQTPLPT